MSKPEIVSAHEEPDGMVTAVVRFPSEGHGDGPGVTVRLPNWATREHFITEAERLRALTEAHEAAKKERPDLLKPLKRGRAR